MAKKYDAVIIGSGPNGLAAAITLAKAGKSVIIYEAKATIGGGLRSAELTLPGFLHDVCSAIHPMAVASPVFQQMPLKKHGLEWIVPPISSAHPFDDGSVAYLEKSLENTAKTLGVDEKAYLKLMTPLVNKWSEYGNDLLGPLTFPKHPLALAHFAYYGLQSLTGLNARHFKDEQAKGLLAGLAAHSFLSLDQIITASFGLVLGCVGHIHGWPLVKGGSQKLANALGSYFISLGGEIVTNHNVDSIDELPQAKVILCDVTPKQLLKMADKQLPQHYKKRLENYRYGPGVFKMDWALSQPIPWKNADCLKAGTLHLGGNAAEMIVSEKEMSQGIHPQKPYVLLAQQSLFDPSRAPDGKHTAWGYCHVPNGSTVDMTDRIESQIERFAPGFKDCVLARHTINTEGLQSYNANYIGGDIIGGVQDIYQLFTRPVAKFDPYATPAKGLYFCSSSTPPGGGVHGMCGYHAARSALKHLASEGPC